MKTAVMLLFASLACAKEGAKGEKIPTAVRVQAVERSAESATTRYSANIEPYTRVEMAFKVPGYVESIAKAHGLDGKPRLLQEGDRIERGAELCSVRKADYQQKLAEAKASLAEAVAAREKAQLDYGRAKTLAESNTISTQQLDAARVAFDSATARADGARVRVDQAQTALNDTVLRAPMDGIVLRRSAEVGMLAAAGTVAFSVGDTATMKVVFGVPDTVVESLRLGTQQTITSEALPGLTLTGHISRISPVADPKSRVFEVEISIPNPNQRMKAGMIAALKLGGAEASSLPVAVLPLSAIVRAKGAKGRYAVVVVDDRSSTPTAHLREVTLGEFLGNKIPIKSGLADGEKVVVMGATLVADGDPVHVIP